MIRLVVLRVVVWGFSIVFLPSSTVSLCACSVTYKVGDEFSKLRGRKGNGRRAKKTMERGKGKGSRMMAYLRQNLIVR
jgi:hypothetical protein